MAASADALGTARLIAGAIVRHAVLGINRRRVVLRADQLRVLRAVLADLTSAQAKALLGVIVFADANGVAWPSQRTLAASLGWSKSYLRRVLRELRRKGLLLAEERTVRGGKRRRALVLVLDGPPEPRFQTIARPPLAAEPVPLRPQPQPPVLLQQPPSTPQQLQQPLEPPCPLPPPPEAGEEALEEWAESFYEQFERWAIETEPPLEEAPSPAPPLPLKPMVRPAPVPLPRFDDGLAQPVRLVDVARALNQRRHHA
jgi:DNA-binding MarR family transcriptional regulator